MGGNKEKKSLGVEDLEKRVAPLGFVVAPSEPLPEESPTGGGGTVEPAPVADQPGNSDNHRAKLYQSNQE